MWFACFSCCQTAPLETPGFPSHRLWSPFQPPSVSPLQQRLGAYALPIRVMPAVESIFFFLAADDRSTLFFGCIRAKKDSPTVVSPQLSEEFTLLPKASARERSLRHTVKKTSIAAALLKSAAPDGSPVPSGCSSPAPGFEDSLPLIPLQRNFLTNTLRPVRPNVSPRGTKGPMVPTPPSLPKTQTQPSRIAAALMAQLNPKLDSSVSSATSGYGIEEFQFGKKYTWERAGLRATPPSSTPGLGLGSPGLPSFVPTLAKRVRVNG